MTPQSNSGSSCFVPIVFLLASTASTGFGGYLTNIPVPAYNYTITVPSRKTVSYGLPGESDVHELQDNIIKMKTIKQLSIKIRKPTKLTFA